MLLSSIMESKGCRSCGSTIAMVAGTCGKCGRSLFGDKPELWGVFAGIALLDVLEFLALTGWHLGWLDGP